MSDLDARASRVRGYFEAGELIEASACIAEWLAALPDDVDAAIAQAQLLRLCGRYGEARAWVDRAIAAAPTHAPAYVEAARLATQLGELDHALGWFSQAHRLMPSAVDWFAEWGAVAQQSQRADIGLEVAKLWCEAQPLAANAWFLLGLVHQHAGAHDAALAAYRRAMELDADAPMLRNNLAALHASRGELADALRLSMDAIRSEPGNYLAWTNLANTWLQLREPANALLAARRAATLAPAYGLAQLALSNTARESQLWDEAFEAIVRAAQVSGADPQIQFSTAMLQLMRGDFHNGWINFEARWQGSPELRRSPVFCPERRWRGEPLAGKTLLIWGEQGHGDALQFIRFVPMVAKWAREAGGAVVCCTFPPLVELFKRSLAGHGVNVVPSDIPELPGFDYQIPLASLPLALGVTLQTLPAPSAYLLPAEEKVDHWQRRIHAHGARKIGLAWTGSRTHQRNPLRAVPPELLAHALVGHTGAAFYCLQKDAPEDVARLEAAGLQVADHTAELRSFDDTAALISNLDLVVTGCTSVAHLAAALGKPTWLLLDVNPHWVWMTERQDSPWYPTVRLYRQCAYQDWSAPLAALRGDMGQWIAARAGALSAS